jgi:hypothetical protein
MNQLTHPSQLAYRPGRTALMALIVLTQCSFPIAVQAKKHDSDSGLGWIAGVTAGVAAVGAGLYGIYHACNSHSFTQAQKSYDDCRDTWRTLQAQYRDCSIISDCDLVQRFGSDIDAYNQSVHQFKTDRNTLEDVIATLGSITSYWSTKSDGKQLARKADILMDEVRTVKSRVDRLVHDLEARACMIRTQAEIAQEHDWRSKQLLGRSARHDTFSPADVEYVYHAERFPYITARDEVRSRSDTYRSLCSQIEQIEPPTETTRKIAEKASGMRDKYETALQTIVLMRGFGSDKQAKQEYEFQCRAEADRRKELELKERHARIEREKLDEDRRRTAQLERQLDLKEKELSQHQQDLILRGIEVVAHGSCKQKERDLQDRIDSRDCTIVKLEREIKDIRRELRDIRERYQCADCYMRFRT